MKGFFNERNIVVILFIMVMVSFSFAQNQTKKIERLYQESSNSLLRPSVSKPEANATVAGFIQSPGIPE